MFDLKNNLKAHLARLFYVVAVLAVFIPSFGLNFIRDFFDFSTPAWQNTWSLSAVIIAVVILQWMVAYDAGKRFKNRELLKIKQ
jgi:multisubunit Na+/H+ antiporter MnhG subunit